MEWFYEVFTTALFVDEASSVKVACCYHKHNPTFITKTKANFMIVWYLSERLINTHSMEMNQWNFYFKELSTSGNILIVHNFPTGQVKEQTIPVLV